MNQVYDILQRAMWWFALTRLAYISLNAMLLPDDNVLQFTFIVGSTIPLIFLVRLHREGVGTRFCTRTPPSVTGAMEIEELKRKRDLLSGGHFNPSGFALVSVLEATVFMLQFFGPAYAAIRWFQGEPLPDLYGLDKYGVPLRGRNYLNLLVGVHPEIQHARGSHL